MDKYEFNLKIEQMRKLVNEEDYATALKIAESIEWERVRNTNLLTMAATVFEKNDRLDEARNLLVMALERAPVGKRILFKLAELSVRSGDMEEAEDYYHEYHEIAPDDTGNNLLQYMLLKAKHAPYDRQLVPLERYCESDPDEKWLYELATSYEYAGRVDDCVRTCDRIALLYGDSSYSRKALRLKQRYANLTEAQRNILTPRTFTEEQVRAAESRAADPAANASGDVFGAAGYDYGTGAAYGAGGAYYANADYGAGASYGANAGTAYGSARDAGQDSLLMETSGADIPDAAQTLAGIQVAEEEYEAYTAYNADMYRKSDELAASRYEDEDAYFEAYVRAHALGEVGESPAANEPAWDESTAHIPAAPAEALQTDAAAQAAERISAPISDYVENGQVTGSQAAANAEQAIVSAAGQNLAAAATFSVSASTEAAAAVATAVNTVSESAEPEEDADGQQLMFDFGGGEPVVVPEPDPLPEELLTEAAVSGSAIPGIATEAASVQMHAGAYAPQGAAPATAEDQAQPRRAAQTPASASTTAPAPASTAAPVSAPHAAPVPTTVSAPTVEISTSQVNINVLNPPAGSPVPPVTIPSAAAPAAQPAAQAAAQTAQAAASAAGISPAAAQTSQAAAQPVYQAAGGTAPAPASPAQPVSAAPAAQPAAQAAPAAPVQDDFISGIPMASPETIAAVQAALDPKPARPAKSAEDEDYPYLTPAEPITEERSREVILPKAAPTRPPVIARPETSAETARPARPAVPAEKFHMIIEAETIAEGLEIAIDELKAIHEENGLTHASAKTTADKLNQKGLTDAIIEKVRGRDFVIERAGDLEDDVIEDLYDLIRTDHSGTIVVLIDTPDGLDHIEDVRPELFDICDYISDIEDEDEEAGVGEVVTKPRQDKAPSPDRTPVPIGKAAGNSMSGTASAAAHNAAASASGASRSQAATASADASFSKSAKASKSSRYEEDLYDEEDEDDFGYEENDADDGYDDYEDAKSAVKEPQKRSNGNVTGEKFNNVKPVGAGARDEQMEIDDFARYCSEYAASIDCNISGKSMLALYERIELMEEDGIPLTRANAEQLIEEAADRAEKPPIGKRLSGMFHSKYDKNGLLILKEDDFIF